MMKCKFYLFDEEYEIQGDATEEDVVDFIEKTALEIYDECPSDYPLSVVNKLTEVKVVWEDGREEVYDVYIDFSTSAMAYRRPV